MKKEKVVVLGSNAFSAQSFINQALNHGFDVHCIYREGVRMGAEKFYNLHDVKWHQADIKCPGVILEYLNCIQPEYIVNYAAKSEVAHSWNAPEDWMDTNVSAFAALIDGLKDVEYLKKFIHSSTPEVYGSTDGPTGEMEVYRPSTPYAMSKACGDLILSTYHKEYGFPFIRTRVGNIYGEGQQLYKIIPKSIYSILSNHRIPLHGGGKSKRAFIYTDDVARAMLTLISVGELGESYHISNEETVTIKELVETICLIQGRNHEEFITHTPERKGKDKAYELSSNKMHCLGWEPQINLKEGISKTANWMTENKNFLDEYGELKYEHKA